MEIKITLSLNDSDNIVLSTSEGYSFSFNEMRISAEELFTMLSYKVENVYVLTPLEECPAEKQSKYKAMKAIYGLLEQLIGCVNSLELNDSKIEDIELKEK